jgi:4,5-dihydroxyphthalate decarboxylase
MKDLYDIEASDIEWFNMRSEGLSHGIELGLDRDPPPGVTLHWMSPDADPIAMFERGEIDAGFSIYEGGKTPAQQIQPLLPDGGREVIIEHFRKTGTYQTNHHYVVQQRIIDEHPWVAMSLYRALEESKRVAYERMGRDSAAYVYFEGQDPDEHAAIFGEDPYPFGLQAMRPTMERLVQASYEQGLIRRTIDMEEIYHPSMLDT